MILQSVFATSLCSRGAKGKATADKSRSGASVAGASVGDAGTPWYGKFTRGDPLYDKYMEEEWGFETHGDTELFEMLILEGAQAGLSWATILKKREAYRVAYDGFDIATVAAYNDSKHQELLGENSGIVRNRLKVAAATKNAKVALEIQAEHGSLDSYLWSFVPESKPILNQHKRMEDMPSQTEESRAMSAALKKQGMTFVGPTITYAFMQACGMVVDHPRGTPQWTNAQKRLKAAKRL